MALDIVDQDFYTYEEVESEYLEKRQLRKGAYWLLLWGLGVGGAISGQFFGWNLGLSQGGFWGMVIATLLVTIMYICLAFSIAELSAALPGAGGLYSFTRYALGPFAGFICGILMLFQYLVMPAVMVVIMGQYLDQLGPDVPIYLWWLLLYTIFVLIHIGGVIRTLRLTLALTGVTILILLGFYVSAVVTGSITNELLVNLSALSPQLINWLPKGWLGIFLTLPSALWFYVAVELLPLAAEETDDVAQNMPRAVIGTILTLFVLSLLTLFIASHVGQGPSVIAESEAPLSDGLTSILGLRVAGTLIGLVALMSSFHAIIYAYGRVLFALSRAGYLPRWLSITTPLDFPFLKNLSRDQAQVPSLNLDHIINDTQTGRLASLKRGLRKILALQKHRLQRLRVYLRNKSLQILNHNRQTPVRALIVGAVVSLIFTYFISNEESIIGVVLFNTAIFTIAFCYMMVFASYIVLKRERADLPRPYKSPLGTIGALVGLSGMALVLLAGFFNAIYFPGLYGIVVILVLSSLYFVFYGRKQLVAQAPGEARALKSDVPPRKITITRQQIRKAAYVSGVVVALYALGTYLTTPPSLPCIPNCMGMNLTGRYLEEANLAQVNLVEANLRGANLSGANLREADLSGAVLVDAILENTDLSGAKLLGVDLSRANLGGAILNNTDMSGADLVEANLTKVDLTQVKLKGTIFSNAKLVGANLSGVNLAGVRLASANLNGADLSFANLSGVSLSKADLSGAQLNDSNLSGAWLNLSNLIGANLTRADLDGASLIGAKLASANLSESQLVGTILVGADFNGANLRSANLSGAQLRKSQLRQNALEVDPVLLELNKTSLDALLLDITLSGIQSNNKTILPEQPASQQQTLVEEEVQATEEQEVGTIKVGILHSLSGPLAISEAPVYDATLLAINEINEAGGVLGQRLIPVVEDGASDWQFFAEKALKLLNQDKVVVVFGGWTSSSRQAVRPIFETLNGLLFYPSQYEGQEQSANIIYTGAEPSQQILPAVEYLLRQGDQKIFLLGSDYIFPRTANKIIKAQLANAGGSVVGEAYLALGDSDFTAIISQIQAAQPDAIFNTLSGESNMAFFKQLKEAGITPQQIPVMSASIAEEEVRQIGHENIAGHLTAWTYYQTIDTPENLGFVTAYKTAYGSQRVTSDPIHAGYFGVYLWKAMVQKANSTDVDIIRKALTKTDTDEQEAEPIEIMAPGGVVRLDPNNQHTYKIARIGFIREDGLIDEIFSSNEPIKPDPLLLGYEWAVGLFSKDGESSR